MKTKRLIGLASLAVMLSMHIAPIEYKFSALAQVDVPEPPPAEEYDYYVQTFIISGYYSPLPNQERYATGSYASDIYLNGNGTNGADGTPVYPGMVACPKKRTLSDSTVAGYDFGTKFYIPGIGLTTCHDRGGAIVIAGDRNQAHDRLDIWFGYGDEGLKKALNWGKRTVDVMVYGQNPNLKDEVYFNAYLAIEDFVQATVLSPLHFNKDIYYGTDSSEVSELVNHLIEWGYYKDEPTSLYGPAVAQAVFEFQRDFGILSDPTDISAGHFGIKTRTQFDKLLKDQDSAMETIQLQRGSVLLSKYEDLFEQKEAFASALSLGDSGKIVTKLQNELIQIGLLRTATGTFDEATQHAVFKFQQMQGLVKTKDDLGAGYVGPATRNALNAIIDSRYANKSIMAYKRDALGHKTPSLALPDLHIALNDEE